MCERICSSCVSDESLRNLIDTNYTPNICSYCGETGATFSISEVAAEVDRVIDSFYVQVEEVPARQRSTLTTAVDLISDWICEAAADDVDAALGELWFDHGSHCSKYGDDPLFEERRFTQTDWTSQPNLSPFDERWSAMEHSLKFTSRYVNATVMATLSEVFGPVAEDETVEGKPVVVEVGPGHAISEIYRARVFQSIPPLERALRHPERELGAPPPGVGTAGRMNAAGISVFYAATHPSVAIAEVRPPVGAITVVAKFEITRPLRLLDLTLFSDLKFKLDRLFDGRAVERAWRAQFAKKLVSTISLPVMPELAGQDYLVTQAIADYLSSSDALMLDGLLLESTQVDGDKFGLERNVILFEKAAKVLDSDVERGNTMEVDLWVYGDGEAVLSPEFYRIVRSSDDGLYAIRGAGTGLCSVALRLNPGDIKLHTVVAADYTLASHSIQVRK